MLHVEPPSIQHLTPRDGVSFTLEEIGDLLVGVGPLHVHRVRGLFDGRVFEVLVWRGIEAPLNALAVEVIGADRPPRTPITGDAVHAVQIAVGGEAYV